MATKKSEITRDKIVSMYMKHKLENAEKPKSVYQFAKENDFEEKQFYSFFGTLESIEKEIYKLFFDILHINIKFYSDIPHKVTGIKTKFVTL